MNYIKHLDNHGSAYYITESQNERYEILLKDQSISEGYLNAMLIEMSDIIIDKYNTLVKCRCSLVDVIDKALLIK